MASPRNPAELERLIRSGIPLARAMALRVAEFDGERLALAAPLAPNVNDKGCAFGGSLASLLTLAAWGLVNLKLGEAGLEADVYVGESTLRYLAPVWGELHAEAYVAGDPWPEFLATLGRTGKARIDVEAEIVGEDGGAPAARQSARFVAIARTAGDRP
jgi:thioesterase domain-containing protein